MDPDQLTSRNYGRYAESSKYERTKIPGYDNFGHAGIMNSAKGEHMARGVRYDDELPDPTMPRPSSLFPSAGPTGKRGSRACVSCEPFYHLVADRYRSQGQEPLRVRSVWHQPSLSTLPRERNLLHL